MQLFYDNIVYALQRFGGISTYWYELTSRFLKEQGIDMHFYETDSEKNNVLRPLLPITPGSITVRNRGGIFLERFRRISIADAGEQAVFHSSYFRVPQRNAPVKKVCTVHDFIHDKFYPKSRVLLHNLAKKRAIEESDAIITVSHNTKKDLLHYYPQIDPGIVFPVYNGANADFKPLAGLAVKDSDPYFLYVGAREKYKNFDFAIALVAQKKDFYLYIVGGPLSKAEEKMLHDKLGKRYRLFSGIATEKLNELYNGAFCLLYPSNYEGFGIPLLEAMQAGCPFIALNASSIPEVAGSAGRLLEHLNVEEGEQAIRYIEENYETVLQAGFRQADLFSWDKCFEQTKAIYNQLI